MLSIPTKHAAKADIKRPLTSFLHKEREKSMSLSDRLQKFNIFTPRERVDEGTASMHAAFESLHNLRKEVANIADGIASPTVMHYRVLLKYYAQLNYIEGRFPISKDAIRIDFAWADAFATDIFVKLPVLLWEKVAVLWNMGAIQNNIGVILDHSREDGAKAAASHFSMAAGIFTYIKELINDFKDERTRDISPQLLTLMVEVALANAQHCVYEGARAKGMKDAMLSRIALATSNAYQQCFEYARLTHAREDWIRLLEVTANTFHASAQYWQSKVDHDNAVKTRKDWGIECGRLAYADSLINKAIHGHRCISEYPSKSRTLRLEELRRNITAAKLEAENNNRSIYFCIEPTPNQLAPIVPLALAKAKSFSVTGEMEGIDDYFADFVPRVVSNAITEFQDRVNSIVESTKEAAQTASDTMRATLASLGLPASLQASNSASGLPASVWTSIAAVQHKGGGGALETGLKRNQDKNRSLCEQLDRAAGELSSDASEELKRRQKYGVKWQRNTDTAQVSTLRGDIDNYRSLLQQAADTDNLVRSKLLQHQDDIAQLGCTRQQLDSYMPKLEDINNVSREERAELEQLVVQTSTILENRDSAIAQLDATASKIDVKTPLLRDSSRKMSAGSFFEIDDKEAVFEATLKPLNDLAASINEGVETQGPLLERVTAANEAFTQKQQANPILVKRSSILTGLQQGVSSFEEIEGMLDQGRKWYIQFEDRVKELCARVQDYRRMRDLEARDHEAAIQRAAVVPAPAPPPAYGRPPASAPPPSYHSAGAHRGPFLPSATAKAVVLPGPGTTRSAPPTYARAMPVQPIVRATAVKAQPIVAAQRVAAPAPAPQSGGAWACKICTFKNEKKDALACEMCNSIRE